MMTLMTVRVALEYLWDQQYTVQSVASTRWQLTPPSTGRRVDVPLVICTPAMVIDVAVLHQMVLSQALAVDLTHHLHRQAAHAVVAVERLRWQVRPAGQDRWWLHSSRAVDRAHAFNGQMIGIRRLWSGAMDLERAALATGVAHIRRYGTPEAPDAPMLTSFLDE